MGRDYWFVISQRVSVRLKPDIEYIYSKYKEYYTKAPQTISSDIGQTKELLLIPEQRTACDFCFHTCDRTVKLHTLKTLSK